MKHRLPYTYKGHRFDVEKKVGAYWFGSPDWRGMTVFSRDFRQGVNKLPGVIEEYLEFMASSGPVIPPQQDMMK